MGNYRKSADCTYDIKYHLVWISKYREPVITGQIPPHLSASKPVQYIKENTSRKLQMVYKDLNIQFWNQHLWARGHFVASSGNVTDEIIKEYIDQEPGFTRAEQFR